MKKSKIKLVILALFFISNRFLAQDTTNYIGAGLLFPVSWTYIDTSYISQDSSIIVNLTSNQNFRQSLNSYMLPSLDNGVLQNRADSIEKFCKSCSYGKHIGISTGDSVNLKTSAQYYNPNIAGGKLWIMRITSQTALGLKFYFSKFSIPLYSSLSIYTADRTKLLGPYSSIYNNADTTLPIQYASLPIWANDIYVEYYESDSANSTGIITFADIIHLYSSTLTPPTAGSAAYCQKDVCNLAGVYDKEVNSVAIILASDGTDEVTCSGALLNNTNNDYTPYFLTASHCIGDNPSNTGIYNPNNWTFIFDYQKDCSGSLPQYRKVVNGATQLAFDPHCSGQETAIKSDYLFLKLKDNSPSQISQLGLCYSGWLYGDPLGSNYNYDVNTAIGMIHHPQGDVKKLSRGSNLRYAAGSGDYDCSNSDALPTGTYFYDFDINPDGTGDGFGGGPEPGSSGSPIFVSANGTRGNRLIGTVTGASATDPTGSTPIDPCTQSTYLGYYGQFNQDWSLDLLFKNYLDPLNLSGTSTNFDGVESICNPVYVPPPPPPPPPPPNNNLYGTNGIQINGTSGIPLLCSPVLSFLVTPIATTPLAMALGTETFDFQVATVGWPCGLPETCGENIFGNCYTAYYAFEAYLFQLNDDYSIANSWTHQYNIYDCSLVGAFDEYRNSIPIGINDIHRFGAFNSGLPPGLWGFGIAQNYGSSWLYSSQYFYVLPNNFVQNNSSQNSIPQDLIASGSITLGNVTVPSTENVSVSATNYINLEDKSHFESGHYFIKNEVCGGQFRTTNPDGRGGKTGSGTLSNISTQNNVISSENQNNLLSNISKIQPGILLYPNPTDNDVVIDCKNSNFTNNKEVTIRVYNSTGQIIMNQTLILSQPLINLSLGEVNAGMYNVIVNQGARIYQSKIVKQ